MLLVKRLILRLSAKGVKEVYPTSSEFTATPAIIARTSNPHATRGARAVQGNEAAGMAGAAMLGTHAEPLLVLLALLL